MGPEEILLGAAQLRVVERVTIEARPEIQAPAPAEFTAGATGRWLEATLGKGRHPWRHQSSALALIAADKNVVIATSTASGKSLVFQAAAVRELLSGDGTILAFYPQKSLANDQDERWRTVLAVAGLDPKLVGQINGDIPNAERERVLAEARVILATPDVVHSWKMRQTTSPSIQLFLKRLRYVVIDEAHALDGAFGTNCAFLFRRLRAAVRARRGRAARLHFIAATATIADPAGHLNALTGCEFEIVGEELNGAPSRGLTLLHVEAPEHGQAAEAMAADVIGCMALALPEDMALLAYTDSRQGAERITRTVNLPGVVPYRSGYVAQDRRAIEQRLRSSDLQGVVSTSALEMGIDVPQFTVGLNIGIPQTRKAFRQRVGRIGRAQPGVFVVLAPPNAFAQLGSSLREFVQGPVEPSPLYLDNLFIQFQHARCYLDETDRADGQPVVDEDLGWPATFDRALAFAEPGARRPADLDAMQGYGLDLPHLAYPLRRVGDAGLALKDARSGDLVGTIDADKALREAYPGAIHYHNRQAFRVREWRTTSYEKSIMLERLAHAQPTKPLLKTLVSVAFAPDEIIDHHLLLNGDNAFAEGRLRVVESVEGYRVGTTVLPYKDIADPKMCRKQREFSTTGIVLKVAAPWFAGTLAHQVAARQAVATGLERLLTREYGISPSDVRTAHSGIALHAQNGPTKTDDCVVLFDDVPGGLRLTAPLYRDFQKLLEQLRRAVDLAGTEALIDGAAIDKLSEWREALGSGVANQGLVDPRASLSADEVLIYAPQSEVSVRYRGSLIERRLLEPQFVSIGGSDQLMYRYEVDPGVQAWVAHDQVQASGHDWRRAIWNPSQNKIREFAA